MEATCLLMPLAPTLIPVTAERFFAGAGQIFSGRYRSLSSSSLFFFFTKRNHFRHPYKSQMPTRKLEGSIQPEADGPPLSCSELNPPTLSAARARSCESAPKTYAHVRVRTHVCVYVRVEWEVGPRRLLTLTLPQVLLSRGRALRAVGSLCTGAAGRAYADAALQKGSPPSLVQTQSYRATCTAPIFMGPAAAAAAAEASWIDV